MSKFVKFGIILLMFFVSNQIGFAQDSNIKDKLSNVTRRDYYFPNLDIRSAFKAISASSGVDMVLSPNIKGKVTLNITSKTWQQTVEILCQMFNLHYTIEKEYLYIQTYADYNATAKEATLERRIIKINHSKVEDLEVAVKGLLSKRGTVTILKNSNTMIINDLPTKLSEVLSAIKQLDVETFQVHIQAKIIEVNSQDAKEIGINWSYGQGSWNPVNPPDPPSLNPGGSVLGKSSPGAVANATASVAFGILDGRMRVNIENLLSEGKGEIIAQPSITTLDNTEARIFIGEKRPYNKLDKDQNSTVVFIEAGIELIVTPHLTNDRRIILDIAPQKSDARTDAITRGPIISTTEAKTTVIVENGQTVVIGGLTSKSEIHTERGFPILKDIPILGYFFKYAKTEILKQDLIIFITPNIIDNKMQKELAAKTSRRASNMEEEDNNVNVSDDYAPITPEPTPEDTEEADDEAVGDFLNEIGN